MLQRNIAQGARPLGVRYGAKSFDALCATEPEFSPYKKKGPAEPGLFPS